MISAACRAFDTWLDEGMPEADGAARAHAAGCARCARALDAARALGRALADELHAAPRGFTEAVMARIAIRAPGLTMPPTSLAWWLRAPAHPAAALALMLAAVVTAGRGAIADWALGLRVATAEAVARGLPSALTGALALPGFEEPVVRFGIALGLVPLVLLASLVLYRWSEGWPGTALARAIR